MEDYIHPVVGSVIRGIWKGAGGAVEVDRIRPIDAVAQSVQGRAVQRGSELVGIVGVMSRWRKVGHDVGGIRTDRYRGREVGLLPSGGGLVSERHCT